MYQQLVGRTKKISSPQAHLDGALALIKHRGVGNFKGEVSRGLLYYVRSILVSVFLQVLNTAYIFRSRNAFATPNQYLVVLKHGQR